MQPVIAVTLGSNGFHLFDMRLEGQALQTTRHLYDNVQAESFVEKDGNISAEGMRVIAVSLAKFSNYIQSNPGRVCGAIATGTFRRARNAEDVMTLAQMEKGAGRYAEAIEHAAQAAELAADPQTRLWRRMYWAWYHQLESGNAAGEAAYRVVEQEIADAGLADHKLGERVREKIAAIEADTGNR